MKKLFFTLMMMVVFAFLANTTFAQTQVPGENNAPFEGSTYSYELSGIEVLTDGYATITYSANGATIQNIEGVTGTYTGTQIPITAGSTFELNFDVAYAVGAEDGTLQVTVTDGDGCTNFIQLAIDVQTSPTLDFEVVASEFTCPNLNATPEDNTDASIDADQNSFTYTITPTVSITSNYTYDFDFDITPTTSGLGAFTVTRTLGDGTLSGSYATGFKIEGATSETQVFTVKFNTTEGVASTDYVGTIDETTDIPVLTVTTTSGDGTYDGTVSTNSATVTVKTTPTIGTFTIE